jgi:hypothetical protein
MKINNPIIIAVREATSTAAADRSLINPIAGFSSIEMKSINFSMQVLKISAAQTNPAASVNSIASEVETRNTNVATINRTVAAICNLAFCSVWTHFLIPVKAWPKLLALPIKKLIDLIFFCV